jgi:hypothetical protein
MHRLTPALLLLALVLCACSGDSAPEASLDDPAALLKTVRDAMAEQDSYHASILVTPEGDHLNISTVESDFAGELEFTRSTYATGNSREECIESTDSAGGSVSSCRQILSEVTEEYTSEIVETAKGIYGRQCEEDECDGWSYTPSDSVFASLLGRDSPVESLIDTLAKVTEPRVEDVDDDGMIRVSAGFNPVSIAVEAEVAFVNSLDDEDANFGESCSGGSGGSSCVTYDEEDFRRANKAGIARFDENPAKITIWIDPDTFLISRAEWSGPQEPTNSAGSGDFGSSLFGNVLQKAEIEFSKYGDVTVEVPTLDAG